MNYSQIVHILHKTTAATKFSQMFLSFTHMLTDLKPCLRFPHNLLPYASLHENDSHNYYTTLSVQ